MKRNRPCIVPGCRGLVETGNRVSECELHDPGWTANTLRREAAGVPTGTEWNKLRRAVLDRDNWLCQRCARKGEQIDHKIAVSIGGHPTAMRNLWTLCDDCHAEKTKAERRSSQ